MTPSLSIEGSGEWRSRLRKSRTDNTMTASPRTIITGVADQTTGPPQRHRRQRNGGRRASSGAVDEGPDRFCQPVEILLDGGCHASIHSADDTNNSSDFDGTTSRTRTGNTGFPLLTARSTSRLTNVDELACSDNTSTRTALVSIPSMISEP
jgi:hypothetical protein